MMTRYCLSSRGRFRFQTGKDGERFLEVIEPLRIAGMGLVPRDDGVDLLLRVVLAFRERIQLRLGHDQLFIGPAHRDEFADERAPADGCPFFWSHRCSGCSWNQREKV